MKLSELARILKGSLHGNDVEFHRIVIDSRIVKVGDCFIAIKGDVFDGHDFLGQVAEKKAAVAIVDRNVTINCPSIIVKNTKETLKTLASYYRDAAHIPIIGITGSCGKTTTRALTESILKQCGHVLASQKSFNNDIGLPLTLFQLQPDHDFAVLEMGTNHPGEIAALTAIAKPTVAVVTMVAAVHVGNFASVEAITDEKSVIYDNADIAIINSDDPQRDIFYQHAQKQIITFGIHRPADVMAKNIVMKNNQAHFNLVTKMGEIDIALPLLGRHNVTNALAAASIAIALNISLLNIKSGLETTLPEYGRLNIKKGSQGETLIDDSYNANPTSVKAAIDILKTYQDPILVLGDMGELGEMAQAGHQEVGAYAATAGIKALYCYGPLSLYAAQAFGQSAQHFETQDQLVAALQPVLSQNSTVLVKGSNSMKMNNIVNMLIRSRSHSH